VYCGTFRLSIALCLMHSIARFLTLPTFHFLNHKLTAKFGNSVAFPVEWLIQKYKISLPFKRPRMPEGGVTSVLDGVSGQSHAPAALSARNRNRTHCMGGWVGPRAVRDLYGKSRFHQVSNAGHIQPGASRYINWATPCARMIGRR